MYELVEMKQSSNESVLVLDNEQNKMLHISIVLMYLTITLNKWVKTKLYSKLKKNLCNNRRICADKSKYNVTALTSSLFERVYDARVSDITLTQFTQ